MSESATTVEVASEPRTIVIERRWAVIGGALVAALILALSVGLAFSLGDGGGDRPGGPPGMEFSQQGFAPGMPNGEQGFTPGMPDGTPQQLPQGALPQGAPPMPQGVAPGGVYGDSAPAPPGTGQAPQSGGQGSGGGANR